MFVLTSFIKVIKNHRIVFTDRLAPWQETFADARDGDGDGGGTM